MTNKMMDAIEILPSGQANASIIWMHGLGASGDDFLPILDHFNLDPNLKIRFIFPNAPIRSITINNGVKMRAWYDIENFQDIIDESKNANNHKWIDGSQEIINQFILREIDYGIPSKKIILMGFSQGGALALHTGLRFNLSLGAIICLSGYLPQHNLLKYDKNLANQNTPILFAHGTFDPIIPIMYSKKSYDLLDNLSYNVNWHSYSMPHTIIYEEIIDLSDFLNKILII